MCNRAHSNTDIVTSQLIDVGSVFRSGSTVNKLCASVEQLCNTLNKVTQKASSIKIL